MLAPCPFRSPLLSVTVLSSWTGHNATIPWCGWVTMSRLISLRLREGYLSANVCDPLLGNYKGTSTTNLSRSRYKPPLQPSLPSMAANGLFLRIGTASSHTAHAEIMLYQYIRCPLSFKAEPCKDNIRRRFGLPIFLVMSPASKTAFVRCRSFIPSHQRSRCQIGEIVRGTCPSTRAQAHQ